MSNSLNKVQLIGNMTADAEIRETPNGAKVASFSIATNRKWKDQAGKMQEDVEYHFIVAWSGLATLMEEYTSKGKKLYIEGRLHTRSWEDQSGVKKYKTEIVAESIILLSGGDKRPDVGDDFQEEKPVERKRAPKPDSGISIEDIPF